MLKSSKEKSCQRAYRRIPVGRPVDVLVSDWPILQGICFDISYGGVGLMLPRPVAVGDRMNLNVPLDGGGFHTVSAVVCFSQPTEDLKSWRIGLQWQRKSAEDMRAIWGFVDRLETYLSAERRSSRHAA